MEMTSLLFLLCAGVCCTAALSHLKQFHLIKRSLKWTEAQDICRENYTDLVTLYNREESEQLKQLMASQSSPKAWIGLHRTEHSLKWSNGDAVNDTAWSPLPSPCTEPTCAAILKDNTTWENCKEQKYFMCYREGSGDPFLIEQNMAWYEAQSYCRETYTDLVSIRNEGQKEEVKNKGMNSTIPYWIGLLYDDWEWSDGGRSAYRDWMTNYTTVGNASVHLENTIIAAPKENYEDYTLCSEGSVRIHNISERKSWEQALDYCKKNYHGLLRIETEEDLEVIKQKFNGTGFTGPVWVGLRQSRLFGFWVWTNGLPVGWSNWEGDRQPEQPLSNHCGAMAMEEGYKWSDQDCLSKLYFICEEEL
ncbi:secretory phospholipase A2 receptor-like isoform X1 [Oncorhynchus mykiss]|uniref:Si:dkey-61f9.1 n=1 Tax=Oncorhynchus mykiss TaxID=8022 RepID=A0A8C7UE13_ONCMY|nr:secretory phospholipase A2 receptor-like isoform X1 [Oncorhynchus mykiss]